MSKVEIFTDGACRGNPGPGGWGAVIRSQGKEKTLSGADPNTTNNRMEMQAAIEALRALKHSCVVDLTTDSQYLRKGITEWVHQWQKNGWRNSQKKPVKNKSYWQALLVEQERHEVTWHWVKGHSGHHENERADALANEAIDASQRGEV
jgi:ribonuclease HI